MLKTASLLSGVGSKPAACESAAHEWSIVKLTPVSFCGLAKRTSTTYLNASGKARGKVNLHTPISAAPMTNLRCGWAKPRNLTSGKLKNLTRPLCMLKALSDGLREELLSCGLPTEAGNRHAFLVASY
jgi:hypothetical protein